MPESKQKKQNRLKILLATSEAVPFAKTGGLADVAGTLPVAIREQGHDIRLVMPRYYNIDKEKFNLRQIEHPLGVPMGIIGEMWCAIYEGRLPETDIPVYFIEHEGFYGREGIYNDEHGRGFLDNDNRFVFLSQAALKLCHKLGFSPDVVHVNDWQTALLPLLLNTLYKDDDLLGRTGSLLTLHNMQHQGEFYAGLVDVIGCGWEQFHSHSLEHHNRTNLLKGGIYHADILNTVSEGYAAEIKTPDFSWGLEGALNDRSADLHGILNGIDYNEWNPEDDKYLKNHFSVADLKGKKACKKELQKRFALPQRDDVLLIGMVSRLASQKGVDVIAEAIHRILELDVQFVMLGTGETWAHFYFPDVADVHRDKMSVHIGYDNAMAHLIEAGSDAFLMPSRFEPCGLNQMYSMRYGTLPVVRNTGGLADTVENYNEQKGTGTGFKFNDLTAGALVDTVGWASYTWYNRKKHWQSMIKQAMKKRFTWQKSAEKYINLYKEIKSRRGKDI